MKKINKYIALILCCLTLSSYAEKADRDKPINIEANNAKLDQKARVSIFTGNVMIKQGTIQLLAAHVTLRQDAQGNQYSQGSGTPVKFRQKMDNSAEYLMAQALRFTYDGKTGILTLYDKAWVKRGTDEVKGDVVIYYMNDGTYEAQTAQNKRVNVIITPKKKAESVRGTVSEEDKISAARG